MKYFITYQQFGGGAQAIHNMVINEHPSEWVAKRNEEITNWKTGDAIPPYGIGRAVVLFFSEMPDPEKQYEDIRIALFNNGNEPCADQIHALRKLVGLPSIS